MTIGRSRSPFRALLWKEWCEQRLLWFTLFLLTFAAGPLWWVMREPDVGGAWLFFLVGFLWCAMATLLGANAFGGDKDTETEHFSDHLPLSRQARFWAKVLIVAVLLGVCEGVTIIFAPSSATYAGEGIEEWVSGFFTPATLTFALVAACVASYSRTVLLSAALAALITPFALFWTAWWSKVLYLLLLDAHPDSAHLAGLCALGMSVLGVLAVLLCAWQMWTARPRRPLVRRSAPVLAALAFALIVAAPPVAIYARAVMFASFADKNSFLQSVAISPSGSYVAVSARTGGWHNLCRTALVDTHTGNAHMVSGIHSLVPLHETYWPWDGRSNRPRWHGNTWSPDEKRFLARTSTAWPCPWSFPSSVERYFQGQEVVSVVEVATGRSFPLTVDGSALSLKRFSGLITWYDSQTIAMEHDAGIQFKNIETGQLSLCAAPEARARQYSRGLSVFITKAGLWRCGQTHRASAELLCFRPDLAEATVLTLRLEELMPSLPEGDIFFWPRISSDGQWAAFSLATPHGAGRMLACLLRSGRPTELALPRIKSDSPSFDEYWKCGRFTPDSKALIVSSIAGVGLYDLERRELTMLYSHPKGTPTRGYSGSLSASGRWLHIRAQSPSQSWEPLHELELATGRTRRAPAAPSQPTDEWMSYQRPLDDDRLLLSEGMNHLTLSVVNRDGTGKRRIELP